MIIFFFQTRCLFIRYVQTEQKTLLPISIVRKRFFSIQDFIVMLNFDFILLLYSFHDFIYSRYLTSVYFSESNSIYEKKNPLNGLEFIVPSRHDFSCVTTIEWMQLENVFDFDIRANKFFTLNRRRLSVKNKQRSKKKATKTDRDRRRKSDMLPCPKKSHTLIYV